MSATKYIVRPQDANISVSLTDLLTQQVQLRGDQIAVVSHERHLTFTELDHASKQLAGYLGQLAVTTDECVGLYLDPSVELITGAWGILRAGGAYLPLAPEYPEERLRFMLEDSRTRVVLTLPHLLTRARELVPEGTQVVLIDDAVSDQVAPPRVPLPDDLAYVIYTSGSTGRPKGVMIEHRSIMSQMRWLHGSMGLGPQSHVLQKTPMSFDAAQWEILAPAVGAQVVVGTSGIYRDPAGLINTVRQHGVTMLQCVPTLLQALLEMEDFRYCTSLMTVFSGGEALSRSLARRFFDELPSTTLVNLYGPTECTINATACVVDAGSLDQGSGMVSIGVPVDNTQCYILDEQRQPVEIGTTGELYIGGAQLARGYLNQPAQTEEKFLQSPFVPTERIYRTGDLASWNEDGNIRFSGRSDNQIKLNGYRIELEEIAVAVEEHTWVKHASTIVTQDARTGSPHLIACVELNPKEAALMDQGSHGTHHQSKSSKLQVKAQLANPGVRAIEDWADVIRLPGKRETERQRRTAFARKTYRHYQDRSLGRTELLSLLAPPDRDRTRVGRLENLSTVDLGQALRWLGQFHSDQRLLPKYSYASPGALYATQLYLEVSGVAGLAAGRYYYHPVEHALLLVGSGTTSTGQARLSFHFVGVHKAIEQVYRNNIREVLEFETGHMVGVLEDVLGDYGLGLQPRTYDAAARAGFRLAEQDHYLGSFDVGDDPGPIRFSNLEMLVQVHDDRVTGMPVGLYWFQDAELHRIGDDIVEQKHVIAINQQVYRQAGFGISLVSTPGGPDWLDYLQLGTVLHRLQTAGAKLGIGLMSSGYSSKTGHPQPAARRLDKILAATDITAGASYFCVGGPVTPEQVRSEGMHEDAVHMKGPAEIIKDDLARTLPAYMIPARVLVLNELPLTANGKVDRQLLAKSAEFKAADTAAPYVEPATDYERWLAPVWGEALNYTNVSTADEFFSAGGNSLVAVMLVNRINQEFGTRVPLQAIFEHQRLSSLARLVEEWVINERPDHRPVSRFIPLHKGAGAPVFCWPGLGGYPMNLRLLAASLSSGRSIYGIQAHGINPGETPFTNTGQMAAADIAELKRLQPNGPYTLLGYSFGSRVAFETAWQLEQAGDRVENLLLVCPGNPLIPGQPRPNPVLARRAAYDDPTYLRILFSVFSGTTSGPAAEECLRLVVDESSFVRFMNRELPGLDEATIRRIITIVSLTYGFDYTFAELAERRLDAPITIVKAAGDDYSFLDRSSDYSASPPTLIELGADHYAVLRESGVGELAAALRPVL
ncbi:MAG: amino acid adenylation domain-containing protein [Actinomycetota bacterium]|nr:amino acid adenylation domain-containing protein [Actinomycetota bacterium]